VNLNGGLYLSHTGEPVSAPHTMPTKTEAQWHGERNVDLPDQFPINVELAPTRRTLALGEVGLAGHLELEAQFVPSVGNRDVRFNV